MRFDFGPDLGDDGLHPGPLVIAGTMLGSVQAEQQGDMRIRYRVVQERPRVEQGGEALQGLAVQNVDGPQHFDDGMLDVLVRVLGEHLDEAVELTQRRGDLRRQPVGPLLGHGDSPLP